MSGGCAPSTALTRRPSPYFGREDRGLSIAQPISTSPNSSQLSPLNLASCI